MNLLNVAQHPLAADQDKVMESDWGGGRSPFAAQHNKLGMWVFIASDVLVFTALLAGYGVARLKAPSWPDRTIVFNDLWLVTIMTFILICSSATMAVAVGAAQRGDRETAKRWLFLTVIGGLFFLGSQAFEWYEMISAGAKLFSNPWGVPQFSASFFVITGFHGFHVTIGLIYITAITIGYFRNRISGSQVETAGLYWHFVDIVWVFVFSLFYLI